MFKKTDSTEEELTLVEELGSVSDKFDSEFEDFDDFDFESSDSDDVDEDSLSDIVINIDEVENISIKKTPQELFDSLIKSTNYDEIISQSDFNLCIKSYIDFDFYHDFDFDKLISKIIESLYLSSNQDEYLKIILAIYKLKENLLKAKIIKYLDESIDYFSEQVDECINCTTSMNNASRETVKQSSEIFYKLAKLNHKDLLTTLKESLRH
ncbi:hypothetical protein CTH30272_03085 [Allocatenococcus thiocycli]|nr:hypothetical protein CTH30272_03085 [Catenococcus thiocycli]